MATYPKFQILWRQREGGHDMEGREMKRKEKRREVGKRREVRRGE